MAKHCCICKKTIENESESPVLVMGAFGNPKCLCPICDLDFCTATTSHDPDEAIDAAKRLGDSLTAGNTGDPQIIELVNETIINAGTRAEKIREGTYDFSLDEEDATEEFDITEDMKETEEDRLKTEEEERTNKLVDTITSWAFGVVLVAALVYFIIKFVI